MTTELEKTAREIWDLSNPNEQTPPTTDELHQVKLWIERAETFITTAREELTKFTRKPPKI